MSAVEIDGIEYGLQSDGTAEVRSKDYSKYSGDIIIPSEIEYSGKHYSVTSIGKSAFEGCVGLISVSIPNSVISIGERAFYDCWVYEIGIGLTSVKIGNSVTSIGKEAFWYCGNLTKAEFASVEAMLKIKYEDAYANPLTYAHNLWIGGEEVKELYIPDSVTAIGSYAFSGVSNVTSVSIPNSVTTIGSYAFSDCSGLTS